MDFANRCFLEQWNRPTHSQDIQYKQRALPVILPALFQLPAPEQVVANRRHRLPSAPHDDRRGGAARLTRQHVRLSGPVNSCLFFAFRGTLAFSDLMSFTLIFYIRVDTTVGWFSCRRGWHSDGVATCSDHLSLLAWNWEEGRFCFFSDNFFFLKPLSLRHGAFLGRYLIFTFL